MGSDLGAWSDLVAFSSLGLIRCLEQNACLSEKERDP